MLAAMMSRSEGAMGTSVAMAKSKMAAAKRALLVLTPVTWFFRYCSGILWQKST